MTNECLHHLLAPQHPFKVDVLSPLRWETEAGLGLLFSPGKEGLWGQSPLPREGCWNGALAGRGETQGCPLTICGPAFLFLP